MSKKIKISEIFYSIQGEGFHMGMPAIFIRFAGCNLRCTFCDTRRAWKGGRLMSIDQVLQKIKKYRCNNVVITGGEPTLQTDVLFRLTKKLSEDGYCIHLETNGMIKFDGIHLNWVTISPKTEIRHIKWYTCNELKVVYQGLGVKHWLGFFADHFYLQPCSMENVKQTIAIVKRYPKWRLSLQCQKLINIK